MRATVIRIEKLVYLKDLFKFLRKNAPGVDLAEIASKSEEIAFVLVGSVNGEPICRSDLHAALAMIKGVTRVNLCGIKFALQD